MNKLGMRVLYAGVHPYACKSVRCYLGRCGYQVSCAITLPFAMSMVTATKFDLMVVDSRLVAKSRSADSRRLEFREVVRASSPEMPVLFHSGDLTTGTNLTLLVHIASELLEAKHWHDPTCPHCLCRLHQQTVEQRRRLQHEQPCCPSLAMRSKVRDGTEDIAAGHTGLMQGNAHDKNANRRQGDNSVSDTNQEVGQKRGLPRMRSLESIWNELIAGPASFTSYYLANTRRSVASADQAARQSDLAALPLTEGCAKPPRSVVRVDSHLVSVAAAFSSTMVGDLDDLAQKKVNRILKQAALGMMPADVAIDEVARRLTNPGPFGSLWVRGQAIVRTETVRMKSMATLAWMREKAESIRATGYTLRKKWVSSARSRPCHPDANGQIRELDVSFDVGGEKLMYPCDPSGSESNVLCCTCVMLPVLGSI